MYFKALKVVLRSQGALWGVAFVLFFGIFLREKFSFQTDAAQGGLDSPAALASHWTFSVNRLNRFDRYRIQLPESVYEAIEALRDSGNIYVTQEDLVHQMGWTSAVDFPGKTVLRFSLPRKSFRSKNLKPPEVKLSLNQATAHEFETVRGIGPVLSKRIMAYRKFLGGFSIPDQCYEVYGLDSIVVSRILKRFELKNPPHIQRIDLDTIGLYELQRIPYCDRKLAEKILEWRTRWGYFPRDSLTILEGVDSHRFQRLVLYLK